MRPTSSTKTQRNTARATLASLRPFTTLPLAVLTVTLGAGGCGGSSETRNVGHDNNQGQTGGSAGGTPLGTGGTAGSAGGTPLGTGGTGGSAGGAPLGTGGTAGSAGGTPLGTGGTAGTSLHPAGAPGAGTSGESGAGGTAPIDAGGAAGAGGADSSLPHRPTAVACSPTEVTVATACQVDTDCVTMSGIGGTTPLHCRQGQCTPDACLVDGDCGTAGVCSCQGQTFAFGHQSYGNSCVEGDCKTDADCPSGACAPSISFDAGPFYGTQGYYCRTPDDMCSDDSDCDATSHCAFDQTTGAWACSSHAVAG